MKLKLFFIYILLSFFCIKTEAQKFINQGCYWPNYAPNGTVRLSSDSTSEDWWYDVKTVPSTHTSFNVGGGRYIACGYSGFDDIGLGGIYTNDPCNSWSEPTFNTVNPSNFDLPDMTHRNTAGTIGLVNLTRTSTPANPYVWIYHYGLGNIFFKVIPTSDGGFLATGLSNAFNIPSPTTEIQFTNYLMSNSPAIYYQSPSASVPNQFTKNAFAFPNCPPFSDPEGAGKKRHACLAKVDKDGKLQWIYTYGIVPHDGINGDAAYKNSTLGTDLLETTNGYILSGILQNSVFYGDYANHPFLLNVDFNGNLRWIKQYHDAGLVAEKFTAIKLKSSFEIYVTGERTYTIGNIFCTPPTYSPTSSNCININAFATLEHYTTTKYLSFLKKIDLITGNEVWDLPITTNLNNDSKVRSLDIDINGKILVPVSDQCFVNFARGECLNTYVNKITDFGNSASIAQSIPFGAMRALDLNTSLGVKATADGGFVVVGTKKAYNLNINKDYSLALNGGNGYNMTGFDQVYSQTDAFIAKCNATGNIEWTTIFDNKSPSGGGNILTNIGDPRNQTNLDNWMNFTTTRSKKDIKRQECLYAITTSTNGEIIVGGNMSSNIDDSYIAMVENNCQLDLSNHLIQAINSLSGSPVLTTNMDNFVSSNINTGRVPGNTNEVAYFDVNNSAVINMEAGQDITMYEGTDLEIGTDVDAHINPLHTCTAGPVYSYTAPPNFSRSNAGFANKPNGLESILVIADKIENSISISPNPTTGKFLIKHPTDIKQFEVLDMFGKPLFKLLNHGSTETRFDLSNLAAGIYFLRVENKTETIKIIKL